MIKMAQLEDIRKMYFMEEVSIREISRRTGIHRDTISKYLSINEPVPPKYQLTNITLDHYLELLLQKSRALGNTKVYKPQTMPSVYEEYRRGLAARNPKGNRDFVRILMLLREYPSKLVTEAIELAMQYNLYGYDGVFNIIGQLMIIASPKIIPLARRSFRAFRMSVSILPAWINTKP